MSESSAVGTSRDELIDQHLNAVVDEVLALPEIVAGLVNAELAPVEVRRRILDARAEVTAPAVGELDRVPDFDSEFDPDPEPVTSPESYAGFGIMGTGGALLVVPVIVTILLWSTFPWWGVVAMVGIAGAIMIFGFALITVGSEIRSEARGKAQRLGYQRTREVTSDRWRRVLRDDGVLPFVRRLINEHLEPLQRTRLTVTLRDAPGLRGVTDASFAVVTSSVRRFQQALERLTTGTIGLAGPRGVGKSTLIDFFAGRSKALKITVSAPVQYEPREFVLHLFAAVCRAVLKDAPPARLDERLMLARDWLATAVGALFVGLLAATPVIGADVFVSIGQLAAWNPWLIPAWLLVGFALASVALSGRSLYLWVTAPRSTEDPLVTTARRYLDNITFLQTHTTGWSGKLILPIKAEAGWSRSVQREQRAQTYPEVVTNLCAFLGEYSRERRGTVVIAIDELDKIESAQQAQQFINEIKSIFGASGTQFIVSISEDALASFERRGLPVRDAFDSAFQEVVRVDYLTMQDTSELLNSRVIGLPEPFVWLVHCFSGGLPRDVVRTARAMVGHGDADTPPSLDHVCEQLVTEDMDRKSHAFQLACRDFGDAPEVTTFIRALRSLASRKPLDVLPELRVDGELAVLSRQTATYVYYSATLLEVFTPDRVGDEPATFETLARAKQSLAVHPRLAWLLVDEFREAWGLATVSPD
jgi:hypothetical protein